MGKVKLEVAVFTIRGAKVAAEFGADRIEFCENPFDGGTTPSYGSLKTILQEVSIPVFPIIRPRGGDFFYNEAELNVMIHEIKLCRELGFTGIVIGLLNADGTIDAEKTRMLVDLAFPMEVTFHRAFDRCIDPLKSMEVIIASGCHRILTSGQFPIAPQGAQLIKELVSRAADRIIIMPGSGVNSSNIAALQKTTGATEFHASARIADTGGMSFTVPTMNEKLEFMNVNGPEVAAMKNALLQNQL